MKINRPHPLKVIFSVGKVTLLEVIRDKVLYSSLLIAILIFSVSFLASRLTFVNPERIVMDFGMTAISLVGAFIAVLIGSNLLNRDFERRTALVTLSRPMSRIEFVLGKYFGMIGVLFLNTIILSLFFFFILDRSGGIVHTSLLLGIFLLWIQSIFLCAVALLMSTFSTTSLSVILSVGIYLVGINISQVDFLYQKVNSKIAKFILRSISEGWPNFEFYNLEETLIYNLPISSDFVFNAIFYFLFYVVIIFTLASVLINRKES
ncbi:MAG: hypothetical protein CL678_13565 [Bdellovibrionaceae bacterium]|nr:hypothetical protein [Pseudobdellovibrionaceae bacterium]|tara:strand:+ start:1460 stop:2248 length:789 start_codon:yes stop_codon:yes gene_type:complete